MFIAANAPAAPPKKASHRSTASGMRHAFILASILSMAKARNASNEAMAIMWISRFIVIDMKATARSLAVARLLFMLLAATRTAWLNLLEEVIALIINEDECREVLYFNLPDSLHTELGILNALDALDIVLCKDSCRATD